MKKTAFAAIGTAFLSACGEPNLASSTNDRTLVTRAETDIRAVLREPSAGEFRNPRAYLVGSGARAVCFDVNAKNAFGGFTGFAPMVAIYPKTGGSPIIYDRGRAIVECNDFARGQSWIF